MKHEDKRNETITTEAKVDGTLEKKEVANKIRWKSKVRAGLQSGHSHRF